MSIETQQQVFQLLKQVAEQGKRLESLEERIAVLEKKKTLSLPEKKVG